MITTSAIFCILAFSYVHCDPFQTTNRSYDKETDKWSLNEVWISKTQLDSPKEHYTRKVALTRYDNTFSLNAATNDKDEAKNILRFEVEELNAWLGDTIYVTTQKTNRVLRMIFAKKHEAQYFRKFLEPKKNGQTFMALHNYKIVKIIESNEDLITKREVTTVDERTPINLTVYAELDKQGKDTTSRRFIIRGGSTNEIFAVFNRDKCNFIRLEETNRFVLVVQPRGVSEGKMYYALMLNSRNNTSRNFEEEMVHYTSPKIATPDVMISLAENL